MAIVAGRPTLFLIAGPNGAGKSTFYDNVLADRIAAPFVNADIIQNLELNDPSPKAAYKAAKMAEEKRRAFMAEGRSFVTETVFSHPSKQDLLHDAREAGYRIVAFHIGLSSPKIALARVSERVAEGGHPVPPDKIRERFARNGTLIREAVSMADRAQVFDGSALNIAPEVLAEFANGQLLRISDNPREWFSKLYADLI